MKVTKKTIKPIEARAFDLNVLKEFKEENNLNGVKDKDLVWIPLHPSFYEATKSPGFPKGYSSLIRGHSNTGKSTLKNELIASCQKMGILPVIIETENNFNWEHARSCGIEFEDVYAEVMDEETGEMEKKVIDHNGFFIYADSATLFKKYGRYDYKSNPLKELAKPNRDVACIEDVSMFVSDILDSQMEGKLPVDLCFIWDSIGGSLLSYEGTFSRNSNMNAMWAAGAMTKGFENIFGNRIPASRKEGRPFTNTFVCVQRIGKETNKITNITTTFGKGGAMNDWNSRFTVYVGGIAKAGIKYLSASSKGKDFRFGIKTAIKVDKNHITNITGEGEICSLSTGLYWPDRIEEWKKEHLKELLSNMELESGDVEITEVEGND